MLSNSILIVLLCCVCACLASDLTMGNMVNGQLAYMDTVKLSAIPLKTRTKNVFYNDNSTRIIKGVSAIDLSTSAASATVTAGGVGFTFVNIRLKGERGEPLYYQIRIYV